MKAEHKPDVKLDDAETRLKNERFVARWSRRKALANDRESRFSGPPNTAQSTENGHDDSELTEHPEQHSVKDKTDADMPPIESLDEHSDYSGFMSPKVSEELRRTALRKLFHLSKFNIRDGLDDYDDDFSSFEPLGNIITADMRHQLETAAEEPNRAEGANNKLMVNPPEEIAEASDTGIQSSDETVPHTEKSAAVEENKNSLDPMTRIS